jgi:hypothetical protein
MTTPSIPVPAEAARAAEAGRFGIRFRAWAWVASLGVLLMLLGIALISLVIAMWPIVADATTRPTGQEQTFDWLGFTYHLTPDAALILLVVLVSALGSFVHAATSFADYVGNRQLRISWVWWYLLRVLVGSSLALIFYFAVRGGFFANDASSGAINPYGIAAVSGLVGLFSKQATDKLREIFDTAFRVAEGNGDAARDDSLDGSTAVTTAMTTTETVSAATTTTEPTD